MSIQQIQPTSNFPISRLVPDLGDGVTYYVQAKVRNAATGSLLATVSLLTLGNRLFAGTWRTPADPSGQGLYVTVTSTVYTDASYTVASGNYQAESETFMVYDQYHLVQGLASQIAALIQSADIDYKRIQKMLDQSTLTLSRIVAKLISKLEKKDVDFSTLTPEFNRVIKALLPALEHLIEKEPVIVSSFDPKPVFAAIKASEEALFKVVYKPKNDTPGKPLSLDPIIALLRAAPYEKIVSLLEALRKDVAATAPAVYSKLDTVRDELKALNEPAPEVEPSIELFTPSRRERRIKTKS